MRIDEVTRANIATVMQQTTQPKQTEKVQTTKQEELEKMGIKKLDKTQKQEK